MAIKHTKKAKCADCNGAKKGEPLYKSFYGSDLLLCTFCWVAHNSDAEYICDVGDELESKL